MGMFDVLINTPVKYTRVCENTEDDIFRKSDPALFTLFDKEDATLADVIRILKASEKRSIHRMRENDWAKIMDVNPNYVAVTKSTEERLRRATEGLKSGIKLTDRPLLVLAHSIEDINTELFKIYGYFSLK